ncbi:MAG: YraN family protein [Kribbellaceae bacterium]
MRTTDAVGQYGEEVAARYLQEAGFAILERNWRCDFGEIDIVARDGRVLVICEVKTRRGTDYGSPQEAVTWRKLARLRKLAAQWLSEHEVTPDEVRIDVVGVVRPHTGPAVVEHLRGVA